jgi:hypothetical protein
MTPRRLRWLLNLWPPYLAAGIRVLEIGEGFSHARVRLRRHWFNRNYFDSHPARSEQVHLWTCQPTSSPARVRTRLREINR